ncbi:MAG: beta-lactamase family protein [Saprospiraceae bacterium]|jgi:CubicO group peptidase (beta-lactamase class C family)|nr:beta-lactamase family protein [Saprospiraceae bacterium]MDP4819598.1 beta-lactamase family protein [Saprospiraceae bacterium]
MRKYLFLVLGAMSLGCWSCAVKPSTQVASPRLSPADSVNLYVQLAEVLDSQQLMGLSVVLMANHDIAWEGSWGWANYERRIPVSGTTAYRVASISKAVTAVALMQLAEQGKVDLYADVSLYLGWLLRHPSFPDSIITLDHLLSHRSGIRDGAAYSRFSRDMVAGQLDIRQLFEQTGDYYATDLFSEHAPGTYFSYTNCTWGLIATIVEKVSGERFDQFCRRHIFEPLGMQARFNVLDLQHLDELAVLYRFSDDQWVPQADDYSIEAPLSRVDSLYRPGKNGLLFGPQGSLRSTAADLAVFARMLMNEGNYEGVQVLEPSSVQSMMERHWVYQNGNGDTWENFFLAYGYGIHHLTNTSGADIIFPDRLMSGHPGIAYGLLSDMYFDKASGSGIIFITNGSKQEYAYGRQSTFYLPEESVFEVIYPYLQKLENP